MLSDHTTPEPAPSPECMSQEEVAADIRDYIDCNYYQNIKLSILEEKYHFSASYLTKLFNTAYGYSIYEYLLKVRMERAKELLENPNIKVLDIAERLGYSDNHYFSKAFKTYYNISPTQCRNEYLSRLS